MTGGTHSRNKTTFKVETLGGGKSTGTISLFLKFSYDSKGIKIGSNR